MERIATQLTPLSPYAALLIRRGQEKTLVISDLHIGWEVALAEKGVHVPSQTDKLLDRLKRIVASEKPDRLLLLGDIKHTIARIELEEWQDVPNFFEETHKIVPRVQVILGNHDGNLEALLPEAIEVVPPRGVIVGDVGLFHGHTWPEMSMLSCTTIVVGHVHPTVAFEDPMGFRITRQVWVRAPCDWKVLARLMLRQHKVRSKKVNDPENVLKAKLGIDLRVQSLLMMPSFNDFLGGQAINRGTITRQARFKEFIVPVVRSGSVSLEKAEVYLLDGTFLGTLDRLMKLG